MATGKPLDPNKSQTVAGFVGKHIGTGIFGALAIGAYKDYRAEGQTRLGALGHATLDFVLPELMGIVPYIGYEFVKAAPGAALSAGQYISTTMRQLEREGQNMAPFRTNTFVDSQQIYTMRQAGMALAEQSKYALQQSLMGDEARFMHR